MALTESICRFSRLAFLFTLSFVRPGYAQPDEHLPTETRIYDVRSLLLEVPDYHAIFSDVRSDDLYTLGLEPLGGRSLFRGGHVPEPESPAPSKKEDPGKVLLEVLASALRAVDNTQWPMRIYAGQLVVHAPVQVLERLDSLINALKASRLTRVSVHAYFLLIPTSDGMAPESQTLFDQSPLTPDAFMKHLSELGEHRKIHVVLTGFDGQRVYNSAGRQFNAVISEQAVVATSASAMSPVVRQLLDGVTVEVQPVLDRERGLCLLDLRASLGAVIATDPKQSESGDDATRISTPPYRVAHFAASVAVPLDKVSLVGASHLQDKDQHILLFIRPSAQ